MSLSVESKLSTETMIHVPPDGTPTIYWADGGQSAQDETGVWFWRDGSNGYQPGDAAHQLACNEVMTDYLDQHCLSVSDQASVLELNLIVSMHV